METAFFIATGCYLLSFAGYVGYLFRLREMFQQAAIGCMAAGFCLHSSLLVRYGIQAGNVPVNNLHEILVVFAWATAAAFLVFFFRYRLKVLGICAAPLICLIMVIAGTLPRPAPPDPLLFKSGWLGVHVIAAFLGNGALVLAGGLGVLYLLQEKAIKNKTRNFFFTRLPSLEFLDAAGYACIVTGFLLITIGLITGSIYAKVTWGHFLSWDPKEVWSAITWVFYGVLLHERLAVGWRGRRTAMMAIIGCGVLLFTFLGVNFLLEGHHGPFTAA